MGAGLGANALDFVPLGVDPLRRLTYILFTGATGRRDTVEFLLPFEREQALHGSQVEQSPGQMGLGMRAATVLFNGVIEIFQRPLKTALPPRDAPVSRLY